MNIRIRITVILLAISISGLSALGYFIFSSAKKQFIDVRGENLQAIASRQHINISYMFAVWEDRIKLISSRTQLRRQFVSNVQNPGQGQPAIMRRILADALESVPQVQRITLCDLQGQRVVSVSRNQVERHSCTLYQPQTGTDVSLKVVWSERDVDNPLHLLLASTLQQGGKVIGAIHVTATAQELLNIINNYQGLGNSGETLLARRNAAGDAQFITPLRYNRNTGLTLTAPAEKKNIPIIQALQKRAVYLNHPDTVNYREASVLAVTEYIPGLDWGMVVTMDRQEALKPVDALWGNVVGFIICIAVVVVLAGLVFGRTITLPIMVLAGVAKRVREGDISQRVPVSSHDEVGSLAETFNGMLTTLEEKTQGLEESEKRLKTIMDNTVDGLITIDDKGIIETYNKACEKLFGYKAKETIGRNINMLMPEPYRSEHNGYLKNYKETGKARIIGIGREVEGGIKTGVYSL